MIKMSHLSTIISRVENRDSADSLFEQAVINLMEYIKAWTDYSPEEKQKAIELFDKNRISINGSKLPSHPARLKEADLFRASLGHD